MNSLFFIFNFKFFYHCRKMLIADINELKYQQEDAKKPSTEEDGEGKEDVTFLKLALKYVFSIPKLSPLPFTIIFITFLLSCGNISSAIKPITQFFLLLSSCAWQQESARRS